MLPDDFNLNNNNIKKQDEPKKKKKEKDEVEKLFVSRSKIMDHNVVCVFLPLFPNTMMRKKRIGIAFCINMRFVNELNELRKE